jgi:hypothetical protein
MIRWRVGDRVALKEAPGRWRIQALDTRLAWLEGKDSFALNLTSLSPTGTVGVTRNELLLDTTNQGELQ